MIEQIEINGTLYNIHKNINQDVNSFDNIKCCNCGYNGLVNTGEECCPVCGDCCSLSWKEGEPQEINL